MLTNTTHVAAVTRLEAGLDRARLNRLESQPEIGITRPSVGPVMDLFMPGEALIE